MFKAAISSMVLCVFCGACATDVGARVRTTAARDLSCSESKTRVVDEELGYYRIQGCGMEATYECAEDRGSLSMQCAQVAAYKVQQPVAKPRAGADLAKSTDDAQPPTR